MNRKIFVVDGSSLGWASYYAQSLSYNDIQTGMVFQFLQSLRSELHLCPQYLPMILWDGRAQHRYDLYPGYKAKRSDTPEKVAQKEAYAEQKADLMLALSLLGVIQVRNPHAEADDLARHIVDSFSGTSEIVLMTADRDWLQLIERNVTCANHRTKKIIGVWNIEPELGFKNREQFIEHKALTGDSSDGVPGCGGIGDKTARELLEKFGTVEEFRKMASNEKQSLEKSYGKALARLVTNASYKDSEIGVYDAYVRNRQLVDLRMFPMDTLTNHTKFEKSGEHQTERFRKFYEFCERMGFASIVAEFDDWIKPFEGL